MERYGLIAGNGKFPLLVLEAAHSRNIPMVVVAVKEETLPEIEQAADKVCWLGIGQLGKLIDFFKKEKVHKAVMAGQVKHAQIFGNAIPDRRMIRLLARLPRKNTDSLIGAVAEELSREGIELIDSTLFLQPLLAPQGLLAGPVPGENERRDIAYGFAIAREVARLDLGQTVAVKDQAVVAVEAMEGTDAVIRRAGDLCGGGFCVIKVAKPNQDMRFDVPVVGLRTIESMIAARAKLLAVDAQRTLLLDRDALLARAHEHGISILGEEPQ
ncbi:MAG: UDP-2,3-diacylglucosamine diphosphatase LpxI [Acidobacteria bacterium]|nr:UDP-2,3-diacylglucosamine diphosphatase LpxI [Acidobacteriota bacterium]